jgi:hypothetical protein
MPLFSRVRLSPKQRRDLLPSTPTTKYTSPVDQASVTISKILKSLVQVSSSSKARGTHEVFKDFEMTLRKTLIC